MGPRAWGTHDLAERLSSGNIYSIIPHCWYLVLDPMLDGLALAALQFDDTLRIRGSI